MSINQPSVIQTVTAKKGVKFVSKCYSDKSDFKYKVPLSMYIFCDSKLANKLFLS